MIMLTASEFGNEEMNASTTPGRGGPGLTKPAALKRVVARHCTPAETRRPRPIVAAESWRTPAGSSRYHGYQHDRAEQDVGDQQNVECRAVGSGIRMTNIKAPRRQWGTADRGGDDEGWAMMGLFSIINTEWRMANGQFKKYGDRVSCLGH